MKPGKVLGKYRIEAVVGEGGVGSVYKATQSGPGGFSRPVAVKVLHGKTPAGSRRFKKLAREARVIGRLQHRNVVQVHELAQADEVSFLVMEFVDGTTLRWLTEQLGGAFPLGLALHVGVEMCRGLQYAHTLEDEDGQPLGVVHRDVKPSNILINKQGDVKLSDFGLAKRSAVMADNLTAAGVVKGTPAYMSPEQRLGLPVTSASDVFSLGLVLYELCTGQRIDTRTLKAGGEVPAPSTKNPALPDALDKTLLSVLDPVAGLRPTAGQFGEQLHEILGVVQTPTELLRLNETLAKWVASMCANVEPTKEVSVSMRSDGTLTVREDQPPALADDAAMIVDSPPVDDAAPADSPGDDEQADGDRLYDEDDEDTTHVAPPRALPEPDPPPAVAIDEPSPEAARPALPTKQEEPVQRVDSTTVSVEGGRRIGASMVIAILLLAAAVAAIVYYTQ